MYCKKFENRLTIKKVLSKNNFEYGFFCTKNHGREVIIIFLQNFKICSTLSKSFEIFIDVTKYFHDIKLLCSNKFFFAKTENLLSWIISPANAKFILVIKMLSIDRFSKFLQVLLRQIEIQMLTRKYFSCPPTAKNSLRKFSIRLQILHIRCLIMRLKFVLNLNRY